METTATPDELAGKARFVFRGTVQQLNAATMREVADKSNTAIVRVDQTIQAPKAMSHYDGQEITVQLANPSGVSVGDQVVFFTNPWLFGNDSVAVRSVGHQPAGAQTAALSASGVNPVANLEDRDTRVHYGLADMVVSGTVMSVRILPETGELKAAREHNPNWQEATVAIDKVFKGKAAVGSTIPVRFPASNDRTWNLVHKLHAGDKGHFMLHKPPNSKANDYVLLHADDFEPASKPDRVERLLSTMGNQ